jgi:hypothetical protein
MLSKHAASRNALAVLSAVLRTGAGLRKIAVGIFKHFVLIAVAQLVLKVGPGVAGALGAFFFYCSLADIAVWVLFFCHRALRDEGFTYGVVQKRSLRAGTSPPLRHFAVYKAAVTAFTSV